jgi:hypothetical protein
MITSFSEEHTTSIFRVSYLKMEAASAIMITTHHITQHQMPEAWSFTPSTLTIMPKFKSKRNIEIAAG